MQAMLRQLQLPNYKQIVESMAIAEQADGWLMHCQQHDCYLALNRQLVDAMVALLARLGKQPVLEVCAGSGALASALTSAGCHVIATDVVGAPADNVVTLDASEALRHYRPRTVLGSFVPFDAGIDQTVMACSCVQHYLMLNARLGGHIANPQLWNRQDWQATRLPQIEQWMLSRHDVWLGTQRPILRHGEAWLLQR